MAENLHNRTVCNRRPVELPRLPASFPAGRARAIISNKQRWVAGSELTYHFLELPGSPWPETQRQAVRKAFRTWKGLGISLSFREVASSAEAIMRIGFLQGDGSWSWVGRELEKYQEPDGRNMNFGWNLLDAWGQATALHEIGHALGMPHEHQNPVAGITWNEPAVLAYYAGLPNQWDEETTRSNIIRPLDPASVTGSNWDPRSIMHYPFEPGLIDSPEKYRNEGTPENIALSPDDANWALKFYPPLVKPKSAEAGSAHPLAGMSGAQSNFAIMPSVDREYTLRTEGDADTVIVLFEQDGRMLHRVAADDDSAEPRNASLTVPLKAGKKYVARVRTNYAGLGDLVSFRID